jgi:hypothetical protein
MMVVTLILIDHEILSMVIHTVPLLWHVQKYCQFHEKVKASCTGKVFVSLPRNNAVTELCSAEFDMAYCRNMDGKLPEHYHYIRLWNINYI